jgi:signal transduction histidine kinase
MAEIEYGGNMEKDRLLDKIEFLYKRSRDISYESGKEIDGDFQGIVAGLLTAFGSPNRKVLIIGNKEGIWKHVADNVKAEMEPILQELMINMDKHSRARNVLVRFAREGRGLAVIYTDDGVGFPADQPFGNGLTNTGNRIAGLGGRISFERNVPDGARIRIYLPNALLI